MKRIFCGVLISLLLSIGVAAGAEEEKSGTQVTVAAKAWVNEWKHIDPAIGRTISDSVIVLAGPAVEVDFLNGPAVEASYLASVSDYQFTEAGGASEFNRRDLELGIGKWINRYIGFFTGYRNSSFEEKQTGAKDFSYGLYYRLRGSVPFIGTSSLYGNVTYLSTRFKAEGQAREDYPGWITEIGGRTVFTKQLSMKLGYQWETSKGEVSHVKDSFRGTMLELTYTF